MQVSMEEPTGMWVSSGDGESVPLTFPEFVAGIEDGRLHPGGYAWSRIVTGSQWVRIGDMRLYHVLTEQIPPQANQGDHIWPPQIGR